jgi:nucleolar protein 16
MGRELQKKKNRSGIQKVRQKPKSKKRLLHHPIIAQNWDKSQTLEQNYRRLGLTVKLNKHTGGVEKKAEDVKRAREEADEGRSKDDPLAIASLRRPDKLDVQEAKIERDPKTGKILRVLDGGDGGDGGKRRNPLNDPLADLDSDEDVDEEQNQDAQPDVESGATTEVVKQLEQEAKKPEYKYKFKQTENERAFCAELVKKYGDDYTAMARDMKINYMQRSEGDLKRRIKKWRESGGTVD